MYKGKWVVFKTTLERGYPDLSYQLIFRTILSNQLDFVISIHISNCLELSSNFSNLFTPFRPSIKPIGRFVLIKKTR